MCLNLSYIITVFRTLFCVGNQKITKDELIDGTDTNERLLARRTIEPAPQSPTAQQSDSLQQLVIVMRHGHRQDEADELWHLKAERPWDPPLSELGRQQAHEAGLLIRDLGIQYVITSPFLRCLQTSLEIVRALDIPQGHWLVDWRVCEVCDPRLIFSGRPELLGTIGMRDVGSWMWGGLDTKRSVEDFIAQEAQQGEELITPEVWNDKPPFFPEKLDAALKRYSKSLKDLMSDYEKHRILIVTHGEGVRAAINLIEPNALVYEVKHTGHAILGKESAAGIDDWVLMGQSGEKGVQWYT